MNWYSNIIYMLQKEMNTPTPFGWFHLLWIFLILVTLFILYKLKGKYNDKQLKIVLFIYGFIALMLELIKQVIWSFDYNTLTWDYQWYAFPFQLCTTPIYVSLICLFLKKTKLRDSLLSYIAFVTILGSFMTIIMPDSCFVKTIEVNIHTMWLHCGSFVLSIYLIMTGEVKINIKNLKKSFIVFLIFVVIALLLNIVIYNTGILNGEEFNMFYISPYFTSSLPIYDVVQENVYYMIFLLFYIISIILGSTIYYYLLVFINKLIYKKNKSS